jgi:hypothetical protein
MRQLGERDRLAGHSDSARVHRSGTDGRSQCAVIARACHAGAKRFQCASAQLQCLRAKVVKRRAILGLFIRFSFLYQLLVG